MITKQAYLNLAAVDEDFAAEMEKVAGPTQWMQKGWNWMKGKFGPAPAPGPVGPMGPPRPTPVQENMAMRRARAHQGAGEAFGNYVRGLGKTIDNGAQAGVRGIGNFLGDAVTGGQFRKGLATMRTALGTPMKSALNQSMYNQGLKDMLAGAGKTGLLYGGAGYGGYRMLRGDPASEPEVARMYHQAMSY